MIARTGHRVQLLYNYISTRAKSRIEHEPMRIGVLPAIASVANSDTAYASLQLAYALESAATARRGAVSGGWIVTQGTCERAEHTFEDVDPASSGPLCALATRHQDARHVEHRNACTRAAAAGSSSVTLSTERPRIDPSLNLVDTTVVHAEVLLSRSSILLPV
ncbi:hypothetical protein DAEQUDRAFT_458149 [Daedalea quercina L-15889]|uniref:Uncharacterized protein n=1 Tax=Daedalea quercina L-15889 TaxID=1314783 RepID=A0A165N1S2_9APHY|nr:hypothetical protein DAEQUDRAFT_458149 [Daedalea quercina L-15889]